MLGVFLGLFLLTFVSDSPHLQQGHTCRQITNNGNLFPNVFNICRVLFTDDIGKKVSQSGTRIHRPLLARGTKAA